MKKLEISTKKTLLSYIKVCFPDIFSNVNKLGNLSHSLAVLKKKKELFL